MEAQTKADKELLQEHLESLMGIPEYAEESAALTRLLAASDLPQAEFDILTDKISINFDPEDGWAYSYRDGDRFLPGTFFLDEQPHEAILELAAALTPAESN